MFYLKNSNYQNLYSSNKIELNKIGEIFFKYILKELITFIKYFTSYNSVRQRLNLYSQGQLNI